MYFIIFGLLGLLLSHYFVIPRILPDRSTRDASSVNTLTQFTCMVTAIFGLGYGIAKFMDGTHPVINLFL